MSKSEVIDFKKSKCYIEISYISTLIRIHAESDHQFEGHEIYMNAHNYFNDRVKLYDQDEEMILVKEFEKRDQKYEILKYHDVKNKSKFRYITLSHYKKYNNDIK